MPSIIIRYDGGRPMAVCQRPPKLELQSPDGRRHKPRRANAKRSSPVKVTTRPPNRKGCDRRLVQKCSRVARPVLVEQTCDWTHQYPVAYKALWRKPQRLTILGWKCGGRNFRGKPDQVRQRKNPCQREPMTEPLRYGQIHNCNCQRGPEALKCSALIARSERGDESPCSEDGRCDSD